MREHVCLSLLAIHLIHHAHHSLAALLVARGGGDGDDRGEGDEDELHDAVRCCCHNRDLRNGNVWPNWMPFYTRIGVRS